MWFIPETLDNDVFTGKLINQPFYVEEMEEGGVYSLNTEMLTDWNIYFSGEKYTYGYHLSAAQPVTGSLRKDCPRKSAEMKALFLCLRFCAVTHVINTY